MYFKGLRGVIAKLEQPQTDSTETLILEPELETEETIESDGEETTTKSIHLEDIVLDTVNRLNDMENEKASLDTPVGLVDKKDNLAQTQDKLNALILAFNKVLNLKSV